MNPSDAILYPSSYYRDMAFFVTKCMTIIFDQDIMSPSSSMASDPSDSPHPVIAAAVDGHFSSEWESQVYHFIHAIFRESKLDESVPIGTVVLLDLLGDLDKMGRLTDGENSKLVLPPYPHKDYLGYFLGAFMLAHRLLSRDGPHDELFWENVIGETTIITLGEVRKLENDMRGMLEDNINYYPPPPILPSDPAFKFYCAGDVLIRPNSFIPRLRYLKTKATMYAHIRVRMSSRGEPLRDPNVKRKRDLAMYFPPCHEYMVEKLVFFAKTRRAFPQLSRASDAEIQAFLGARGRRSRARPVGLGLVLG